MEWNDEIIARLRALWDEGHSTAEIGRRLGVSKNAIVGKAHRLSLPPRPSPIRRVCSDAPRATPRRRIVGSTLPPLPAMDAATPVRRPAAMPSPAMPSPAIVPRVEATPAGASSARAVEPAAAAAEAKPALAAVRASPRGRAVCCCWPIGEPGTKSFHFCDADALAGKPYCMEHAQLAYVKVRDRREEAA